MKVTVLPGTPGTMEKCSVTLPQWGPATTVGNGLHGSTADVAVGLSEVLVLSSSLLSTTSSPALGNLSQGLCRTSCCSTQR